MENDGKSITAKYVRPSHEIRNVTYVAQESIDEISEAVAKKINELLAAEKKGKWLAGDKMVDYPSIPYKPWNIYCSCCREKAYNGDILFDYCPFCGAKMEE